MYYLTCFIIWDPIFECKIQFSWISNRLPVCNSNQLIKMFLHSLNKWKPCIMYVTYVISDNKNKHLYIKKKIIYWRIWIMNLEERHFQYEKSKSSLWLPSAGETWVIDTIPDDLEDVVPTCITLPHWSDITFKDLIHEFSFICSFEQLIWTQWCL